MKNHSDLAEIATAIALLALALSLACFINIFF